MSDTVKLRNSGPSTNYTFFYITNFLPDAFKNWIYPDWSS